MLDFQLERLLLKITLLAYVIFVVPASEQNNFSVYKWFQTFFKPPPTDTTFSKYTYNFYPPLKRTPPFHKTFKIIWNIPTFQCHKYGFNFTEVSNYGITQNSGDTFRGDKIALLYDPGFFPALLETTRASDMVPRNGGVPQEGNLTLHLDILNEQVLSKLVPDENFAGVAIIDFEHWRPIWSENFGSLMPYKKMSRSIEQQKHPFWPAAEVEKEAAKRFEKAAWQFFRRTLKLARKLRPKALWGFYGFPLCFNYTPKNNRARCSDSVMENNERIKWLFEESSGIFPSLYYKRYSMSQDMRAMFMKGRMTEANRVAHLSSTPSPIYPYTWFKYYDTKDFVEKNDLINSLIIPKKEGAAGVIIWGSSNDVNTEKKCQSLHSYVQTTLGPISEQVLQTPKEELSAIFTSNIVERPAGSGEPGDTNSVDYVFL